MEIMKGGRRHEKRRLHNDGGLVVMVIFWMGREMLRRLSFKVVRPESRLNLSWLAAWGGGQSGEQACKKR